MRSEKFKKVGKLSIVKCFEGNLSNFEVNARSYWSQCKLLSVGEIWRCGG